MRRRLAGVGCFMRCLDEYITCLVNKEDGCKGSFCEGRFKCLILLDEAALLVCMAYVAHNSVRRHRRFTGRE